MGTFTTALGPLDQSRADLPVIPGVWLWNGHSANTRALDMSSKSCLPADALIDTGAACCYIPEYMAREVGHKVGKGDRSEEVRTANGPTYGNYHSFDVHICDSRQRVLLQVKDVRAIVLPELKVMVLGMHGFLERMTLFSVDPRSSCFTLMWQGGGRKPACLGPTRKEKDRRAGLPVVHLASPATSPASGVHVSKELAASEETAE